MCLFGSFQGIMIVYDITNEESFEHIAKWVDYVHSVSMCERYDNDESQLVFCKENNTNLKIDGCHPIISYKYVQM